MEKLIMLGTGNGGTENLYNTCFVVQIDKFMLPVFKKCIEKIKKYKL